ncbi:Otoferlin [Bienertia sinuspersici]
MLKSWTLKNPGRRFICCKFMDLATRRRGCQLWERLDEDTTEWKKDLIKELLEEKKVMTAQAQLLKATIARLENENLKLCYQFGLSNTIAAAEEHPVVASNQGKALLLIFML